MRRFIAMSIMTFLCIAGAVSGANAQAPDNARHGHITVKGKFGVEFAADVDLSGVVKGFGMFRIGVPSVDRIFDDFRVTEVRPLSPYDVGKSTPMSRIYVVEVPDDVDDERFIAAMMANPNVVRIENDILVPVHVSPDDPSYPSQWHHYQAQDHDIDSPEVWEIETGSDTAIIAIIDTGVNYKHPDLRNNIWINPGEDLDGDRIVYDESDFDNDDTDGNGYRDDVIGFDFFTGGSYPAWSGEDGAARDNDPNDFNGHGTHVAGIAAAVSNNGKYGAGIAGGWGPFLGDAGVRIMCLRAGYSANIDGDEGGLISMSATVEAINYAVNNGAHVINFSAGSSNWAGMPQAVSAAMDSGIVFCASAGNSNSSVGDDYFDTYPGIITVAATNSQDKKWTWSANEGSDYGLWVEVSAPGQDIYSTYSYHYTPTYAIATGTSMSAPMVSGLAALIKSHHPDWDKTVIDTLIINNADDIDGLNPSYAGLLGSGRINAYNCLQNSPQIDFEGGPRLGPAPLTVDFTDLSPAASSWSWDFGDTETSFDQNPQHIYTDPGLYTVSLEATDPNGTFTKTRKYYIFATADTVTGGSTVTIPANNKDSAAVLIYIKNTIPLDTFLLSLVYTADSGTADLEYKSVSFEGTRGEDFDGAVLRASAPASDKIALEFMPYMTTASEPLPPGDGPVAKLWFKATGSGTVRFDTVTLVGYEFGVTTRYADYLPEFVPFRVWAARRGDADDDASLNISDAVYIVEYIFKGGPPPASEYQGDANADGVLNIADAVYLITYIFKGGPPPPP